MTKIVFFCEASFCHSGEVRNKVPATPETEEAKYVDTTETVVDTEEVIVEAGAPVLDKASWRGLHIVMYICISSLTIDNSNC